MKRITVLILAVQLLAISLVLPVANAQTAVGASIGASGSGYAAPAGIDSSNPATIVSPPMPIVPPMDSGFIEFNNLTIENVSGTNPPAEILASNPSVYPMMGASSAGTGVSAPATPSVTLPAVSAAVPSAVAVSSAPAPATASTCFQFETQDSANGNAIACPTPPTTTTTTTTTPTPQTTTASPSPTTPAPTPTTAVPAVGTNIASPTIYPPTYPVYQPYRIEVDASTHLSLNDRTVATLSDFSSGDQINVFGYYNSDGSIQAYLIRDLSKPAQDEFLQLNNVELVSISTSTNPAALVVTQTQGYPCYGFGIDGAANEQSIACPLGVSAVSNSPALQNISVPAALAPDWQMLRKYVITVDTQTTILDSNRTALSLSDLQVGDSLNIYGDTTDNGQTLIADIVRDLSVPATPSNYSGNVTQVNADGSFVIQTSNGQTVTVQNPVQVGAAVQLSGLLDRLTNVLSQVSDINFGRTAIYNTPY